MKVVISCEVLFAVAAMSFLLMTVCLSISDMAKLEALKRKRVSRRNIKK